MCMWARPGVNVCRMHDASTHRAAARMRECALAKKFVRLERVVLSDDVLDENARVGLFIVAKQQRHLPLLLLCEVSLFLRE